MISKIIKKRIDCRVCRSKNLTKVIILSPNPLANAFVAKDKVDIEENFYPLDVYFCNNCSFLQLGHVVAPEVLFGNYVYVSSTSKVFVRHFEDFAKSVFEKFGLTSRSLVIDIGSNDGILLKPFKDLGSRVLGIEPAVKIAKVAKDNGIDTIPYFFSIPLARKIVKDKGNASVVTATNVFAHIDDLDEVINGLKILLDKDGVFIMEAPYLIDFIEKRYFDLVYHEHLSYWAVRPLITLFKRFNMKVFDVKKVAAHGGSIRVFVAKEESRHEIQKSVGEFLDKEKKIRLSNIDTYVDYNKTILENKVALMRLLAELKIKGNKIAGYGAPAKGNTLLNFFAIGPEILDYIVDDSPWKQGLYSPGRKIPVISSQKMYENPPDYLLILAWNFAESIIENNKEFRKRGGRFILPVPKPKVI